MDYLGTDLKDDKQKKTPKDIFDVLFIEVLNEYATNIIFVWFCAILGMTLA